MTTSRDKNVELPISILHAQSTLLIINDNFVLIKLCDFHQKRREGRYNTSQSNDFK